MTYNMKDILITIRIRELFRWFTFEELLEEQEALKLPSFKKHSKISINALIKSKDLISKIENGRTYYGLPNYICGEKDQDYFVNKYFNHICEV